VYPAAGFVCPRCRVTLSRGWTLANHRRYACKEGPGQDFDDMVQPNADVHFAAPGSSDDEDGGSDVMPDLQVAEGGNNAVQLYLEDLDRAGTLDTAHVEQYCAWIETEENAFGNTTLRFLAAAYCGVGSSKRQVQEMLNFTHTLHGSSYQLPRTVAACWKFVSEEHARMTRAQNLITCTYPVPPEVQALMTDPKDTIVMEFVDPTEALVRLLTCSPLCADKANVAFFPEESDYYDDYCTGDRMRRIHEALPAGCAALSGVLFFDEINQDKKGFTTGEGCIIVGGFFRKEARESMYAKASIGTFPGVKFPKVSVCVVLPL
jgi:hypothetical protein